MRELPEGWATAPIGSLCTLINGRAFKPSDWTSIGLPIVRIQNLNDRKKPFNYFEGQVEDRYYIDDGELLFAWSGTPGTSFGAHIWDRGRAILNQHIFRVVFSEGLLDKRYFRHAINDRLEHLVGVAHGGAGLAHVTKPVFESTAVVLPPLNEQKRIVAKLDALQARADTAKQALDAIPPLLEKFRQSVLAAAFRGDLTREWRARNPDVEPASELLARIRAERRRRWEEANPKKKYVEPEPVDTSALPELPEGWCWASVDELISEELANGRSVPTAARGFPVLRLTALKDGAIDLGERKTGAWTLADAERFLVARGDFLVSRGNGSLRLVGLGGVVPDTVDPVAFPDTMIRIRIPREFLLPDYLEMLWNGPWVRRQIEAAAKTTAGIYKVSQSDLRGVILPIPPPIEQHAYVAHVRSVLGPLLEWRTRFEASLSLQKVLLASVLSKAFRGELVPQDPDDEPAEVLLERIRAERAGSEGGGKKKRGRARS